MSALHTEKRPPDNWRACPIAHQPTYATSEALQDVLAQIQNAPPLVFAREVDALHAHIRDAAQGKSFILQGGNCAERFIECTAEAITNQIKILLQMSVILTYGTRKPVVRIGRIAGQYAKPRSAPTEMCNGAELPVYRGDAVNDALPCAHGRMADPQRLWQAYTCSAVTLNFVRSMIDGGFADLHDPYKWHLHSMESTPEWPVYKRIIDDIKMSIDFMESFGGLRSESVGRIDFYTSHEALLLAYEEALTRWDDATARWYNLGAHTLWIGNRTRTLDGAHVAYAREIANPIGVKIDATLTPDELIELVHILNPHNEPGRLTLVTRCGEERVDDALPGLITAITRAGQEVAWSCDPMHGNTHVLPSGKKTRDLSKILNELRRTFHVHARMGSRLAGVHFELTGDDVTECIGGAVTLRDEDLERKYTTECDPRLNYIQSMEIAFLLADFVKNQ